MSFVVVPRRVLMGLTAFFLVGCAGLSSPTKPLVDYQPEAFDGAAYARQFTALPERTCEAARRALLSQGYVLTSARADQVSARKYFQPSADHHVQLEFRVVCVEQSGDAAAAVAFISGLKDQYVVRKVKESASLGVGGIGSLSLPLEGSLDSMVKVASETVTDGGLYERLFDLIAQYLDQTPATEPVRKASAARAS